MPRISKIFNARLTGHCDTETKMDFQILCAEVSKQLERPVRETTLVMAFVRYCNSMNFSTITEIAEKELDLKLELKKELVS